jgi:hypothetical protein
MSGRAASVLSVAAVVMVLAGCASARLQVAIDLYDEDPRFIAPMTPEETVQLIENVEKLRQAAADRTSERLFLATASKNLYVNTLRQIEAPASGSRRGSSPSKAKESEADRIEDELQDFLNGTESALQALEPRLVYAKLAAAQYLQEYRDEYAGAESNFRLCEKVRVSGRYQHAPIPDDQLEQVKTTTNRPPPSTNQDANAVSNCHVSEFNKKVERLDREWILRRLPVCLRTEEAKVRSAVLDAVGAYRSFASPSATVQSAGSRPQPSDETPKAAGKTGGAADKEPEPKNCLSPIDLEALFQKATRELSLTKPARQSETTVVSVFTLDWVSLRVQLNMYLEGAQLGGLHPLERRLTMAIQALNSGMIALAQASKLVSPQDVARAVEASSQNSPSGLLDSSVKIALELETLRTDLPESASAQTALAGLARNSSLFAELIDRLQDAGTPVWRIVSDPSNEEHWNKSPMQPLTDFYAQGKSSVVFVRNDPMRFDVHDATNNPTALIKGQLEISRAVANAAISVAGAATGIPSVPKSVGDTSGGTGAPASTTTETDAATAFAKRKGAADEAERLRDRQIRGLSLELTAILASLATSGSDTVSDTQKGRLDAVLTAYRSMFESSTK